MNLKKLSILALLFWFLPLARAQDQKVSMSADTGDFSVTVKNVDIETTQTIDILLPKNYNYRIDAVESVVVTSPSAITTRGRIGLSSYDGSTATILRGTVPVYATAATLSDSLFSGRGGNGYAYLQNIAAATTSGLITQVATLNTPGTATITAAIIAVPRKLRLVLVDNAGANLAGTVTLVGTNQLGEVITEIITVVAGTVAYDTVNAFASLSSVAHNFGVLGQVTVDTMDLGMDTSLALPGRNAEVVKLVSAGTVEAAGASDPAVGTFDPTTAPDGSKDFEVWYRVGGSPPVIPGGSYARLVITGATVTGDDVRTLIVRGTRY